MSGNRPLLGLLLAFMACSSDSKEPLYAECPEGWVMVGPAECEPSDSADGAGGSVGDDSGQEDGDGPPPDDSGSGGDDTARAGTDSGGGGSSGSDSAAPGPDSGDGDTGPGTGDAPDELCARPISEEDLSVYRGYFPDAECGSEVTIPDAYLLTEDEELGNVDVVLFYGADGSVLGQVRRVFTPVYCTADVCEAILFMLVLEADTTFLDILHGDGVRYKLKKYWEDLYLTFTDEDMTLLKEQLADPPPVLLEASSTDALVEGTHGTAPTLPEYQPFVVRGAAFTCYVILEYLVSTQTALAEILASLESGGAR